MWKVKSKGIVHHLHSRVCCDMVCVAMSWRDFGESAGWHLDVVNVASEALKMALAFRAVELAITGGSWIRVWMSL